MNHKTETLVYQTLLAGLRVAVKAGKTILEVYGTDISVEFKEDKSPLTIADKRSHEIISQVLSSLLISNLFTSSNAITVLSEEGETIPYKERKNREYLWLVDPLDGTKEFIKKIGEFTVNIALIHKKIPILGIIYIPIKDTLYFGAEGLGSYKVENSDTLLSRASLMEVIEGAKRLSDSPDKESLMTDDDSITIIGSRSHATKKLEEFIKDVKKEYKKVEFIPAGSSLKFCLVAEGKADIYPSFGCTNEWDTAAGQAIVELAGGTVLDMETHKPLHYNKENLRNPAFLAISENYKFQRSQRLQKGKLKLF